MHTKPAEEAMSEEMQNMIRLESIFLPHATKQRGALHARNGRFVHYTSAEAALSIINNKRLWLRNAKCMSDYREVQHGFEVLDSFFSDKDKRAKFEQALDVHFPGAFAEALGHFNGWWHSYQVSTYIASISEHDDNEDQDGRLSMWRAFGNSSPARVAIVLDVPRYLAAQSQLSIMFSPVAYLRQDEVHQQLDAIAASIDENAEFLQSNGRETIVYALFNMLLSAVVCLKHRGFHEEREWRVIYNPNRGRSPLIGMSTEVISGIPQTVHKLPLDKSVSEDLDALDFANMFDRLIIGPSPYPVVLYEALTAALMRAGVNNAGMRVTSSGIPIRT